jgi:hypothetical protein
LVRATPVAVGPLSWAIAGMGIGLAYAPLSLIVLKEAPPGQEGRNSAALTLTDVLGTALGTGICGAAVGFGHANGWDRRAGLGLAFAIAFVGAVAGAVLARRLPAAADPR